MTNLFVYGTLIDPVVQQRIFGRVIPGTPDQLAGYRKDQIAIEGAVYPIITLDADSIVNGWLLEVSDEELARADAYEGSEYRRVQVTLASSVTAWVYCE